ncbi:MAG: hypothetical protein ACHQ6T_01340 [Myxococcota bacterium]
MLRDAPPEGHPIANEACRALASASGVVFAGGRIDALVRCEGLVLSTREPLSTHFGVAQARRELRTPSLRLTHVVFAPASPRALLLGFVRLENRADEPLALEYTEIWDVPAGEYRAAVAACERRFGGHLFALAEASAVTRARAPEAEPKRGLALDVALALPAGARRHLAFAYAALPDEEDAGELVRAWRGGVAAELEQIGRSGQSVAAYRELGRYSGRP